jgi:hypothetical protein
MGKNNNSEAQENKDTNGQTDKNKANLEAATESLKQVVIENNRGKSRLKKKDILAEYINALESAPDIPLPNQPTSLPLPSEPPLSHPTSQPTDDQATRTTDYRHSPSLLSHMAISSLSYKQ